MIPVSVVELRNDSEGGGGLEFVQSRKEMFAVNTKYMNV